MTKDSERHAEEHRRMFGLFVSISLDAPLPGFNGLTMLDTLAAPAVDGFN